MHKTMDVCTPIGIFKVQAKRYDLASTGHAREPGQAHRPLSGAHLSTDHWSIVTDDLHPVTDDLQRFCKVQAIRHDFAPSRTE